MYANKKTDVNEKANVTGMKSQKPGKHAHVKAVEVADEGSKTGVIVAVVLVLITVLGVGAAVFIVVRVFFPSRTLAYNIFFSCASVKYQMCFFRTYRLK